MLEFIKQPGVYEACLIIFGVFFYRTVSTITGYIKLHQAVQFTAKVCLFVIAKSINSEMEFRSKLYKEMLSKGEPEESVRILQENELLMINRQASRMVKSLKEEFPKEYHKILPFDDWESGMIYLFKKK